jgi:hypothetical protein
MPRGAATRHDDDQHVRSFGKRDDAAVISMRHIGLPMPPVIGDGHPEPVEPPRHRLADMAEPDDANPLPSQRRGKREGVVAPAPIAQETVGLRDTADRRQQQTDRQVGDLVVEHARCVGHHHVALGRSGGIDVIVADAEAGDDLQRRQPLEQRSLNWAERRAHRHTADRRADARQERFPVILLPQPMQPKSRVQRRDHWRRHARGHQQIGRVHGR